MATEIQTLNKGLGGWLARETDFDSIVSRLAGEPASGVAAWARTTSGIVALLLTLQIVTGALLAFHYVPSVASAWTTVAYIEVAVRNGAWIRSVHYHSSVLLPIALAAHLLQMIARSAYRTNRTAWTFGIVVLALVLAAGATGYALPWDARAVNGVNIAASLTGNVPLVGETLRTWLINGTAISTLTLSRFYGLHALVVPALILLSIAARLFIFGKVSGERDPEQISAWAREQFVRNGIVIGLVFLVLAVVSSWYPAPFGPQIADTATYLPRPGPQFLWLFEMQKYTDGLVAAMLALGFPGLVITALIALPVIAKNRPTILRVAVGGVFVFGFGIAASLTAAAIYQDRSDAKITAQLAKQDRDEAVFRASSFQPQVIRPDSAPKQVDTIVQDSDKPVAETASFTEPILSVPHVYTVNCSKCHGASGEGTKKFPELAGVTTRGDDQLTPDMVLKIIDDPKSVGRSPKMPSYKNKLSDAEKQEILAWIRSLPAKADPGDGQIAETAKNEENK